LERSFEKMEVFKVVKDLNGNKAPGPNGFLMAFFQSCWNVIKEGVKVFLEFHECGKFVRSLNATFISLIPKKVGLLRLKTFVLLVG
jgi:hypothetical protein